MTEHNHEQWPHCTEHCSSSLCALKGCQASSCPGLHRLEPAEDGGKMLMPDVGERPWFEAHVSFEAISRADADFLVDRIANTVCRGHGDDDEHVCKFQFVISGPMEIDMTNDEEIE